MDRHERLLRHALFEAEKLLDQWRSTADTRSITLEDRMALAGRFHELAGIVAISVADLPGEPDVVGIALLRSRRERRGGRG